MFGPLSKPYSWKIFFIIAIIKDKHVMFSFLQQMYLIV